MLMSYVPYILILKPQLKVYSFKLFVLIHLQYLPCLLFYISIYTFAVQPIGLLVKGEREVVAASRKPRHSCAVSAPKISLPFYFCHFTYIINLFLDDLGIYWYKPLQLAGAKTRAGVSSCPSSFPFQSKQTKN
jgi:hypothetical protein